MLIPVAAQGKPQGCAHFPQALRSEVSDALTKALLKDGYRIVKIDCARAFHAVLFVQFHL